MKMSLSEELRIEAEGALMMFESAIIELEKAKAEYLIRKSKLGSVMTNIVEYMRFADDFKVSDQ